MSDTLTDDIIGNDIHESELQDETIIQWLRNHADFFERHPYVLDSMNVPSDSATSSSPKKKSRVADFQSYMIKRLQQDKQHIIAAKQDILETSRANMNNQERIQQAVIYLLDAVSIQDLLQMITMDLAALLGVDISAVVVESDGQDIPHINITGIRIVPEGTITRWMDGQETLIQSDICGIEAIYGGGAQLVKSQILIALNIAPSAPPALIAFGSRDPTLFHDGLGTNQIQFLAAVIERCLRKMM